jgi:hypothetical protein
MNRMNRKKIVAAATIVGALGFTALGQGAGVPNADDDHGPWVPWVPWQPGEIVHDWVPWVPWSPWQPWQGNEGDQGENQQ